MKIVSRSGFEASTRLHKLRRLAFLAIGLLPGFILPAAARFEVAGAFVDRPNPNQVISYSYTASLDSAVDRSGNLAGWGATVPQSSQVGWIDAGGAPLQGDGRYADPIQGTGDFRLMLIYYLLPNHLSYTIAASVHFKNGVADGAWLGKNVTGNLSTTGKAAALKLSSVDQGRIATAGDPVQVATGAVVMNKTLFGFSGARDWKFELSYNSILASVQDENGAVGYGWTHPFETRIAADGENPVVKWNRTQGNSFQPAPDAPGVFVSNEDAARNDKLVRRADGGWELTRRDGSVQRFAWGGWLTESEDRRGRKLVMHYDANGHLDLITDPVSDTRLAFTYIPGSRRIQTITDGTGAVVTLTYNGDDLLSRIVNQNGKSLDFRYDSQRQLVEEKDDLGHSILTNTYDDDGRVVSQDDGIAGNQLLRFAYREMAFPGGNLYAPSDERMLVPLPLPVSGQTSVRSFTRLDGETINYGYDAAGRLISATVGNQITTLDYDSSGRVIRVTDPAGQTSTFTQAIVVTATDRAGQDSTYEFDADFNLRAFTNPNGETTRYSYDEQNAPTSMTDPLNRVTTLLYDVRGNVATLVDPAGKTTRHAYDERGNLLTTVDPIGRRVTRTYDAKNNLLSVADAEGGETTWTYDGNSLPLTQTLPRGGVYRFTNVAGRLIEVTDPAGVVTRFGYDSNGRVTRREDALGQATRFEYDAIGNVVTETDPLGGRTAHVYDHRNRRVQTTTADGASTSYDYDDNNNLLGITDAAGNRTSFGYDGEDHRKTVTDATGRIAVTTFDPAGRLSSILDPARALVSVERDAAGRMTSFQDQAGFQSQFAYDSRGLLESVRDPLDRETTYVYDDARRRIGSVDAQGQAVRLAWNSRDQLLTRTDPGGLMTQQVFDADGNRAGLVNQLGNSTIFVSDPAGKITDLISAKGRSTHFGYDSRGLLSTVVAPSGRRQSLTYDFAQRLSGITDPAGSIVITRDPIGRPVSVMENGATLTRTYDANGRLASFTDAAGAQLKYDYDALGRLIRLVYPDGRTVAYAYDLAGRLETVTDWKGRSTRYSYDALSRVVGVLRPNQTRQTRAYDNAGQLVGLLEIAKDGSTLIWSGEFEYDVAGRLIREVVSPSFDAAAAELVETFDEDDRLMSHNGGAALVDYDGNLLSVQSGLGSSTFAYDARNRLSRAGGIEYAYDAENRRIASTADGARSNFTINPNALPDQLLVRSNPDGTTTYYVYGIGLLHEESGTRVRYYHFDRRGSTVALTDESGVVTDVAAYGTYGELTARTGGCHTPFLFCGRWGVQTDDNGLYYHRARYYHPDLRRFLTEDSFLGSALISGSLNRFAYTRGNPVTFIDPTGYYDEDVHYYLTYNLAIRVGFSPTDAERIASADQGVDDSEVTGPYSSLDARRNFHFTTPERREEMLQMAQAGGDLALFGQYLHAEQDSFSHQRGATDRNGDPYGAVLGHLLSGHGPDRTAARPELAMRMAQDTYDQLRSFYNQTHSGRSCDDWSNIAPAVDAWVREAR